VSCTPTVSGLDLLFAERFLTLVISEVIQNPRQFLDEGDA
jgi:hypothetical protein